MDLLIEGYLKFRKLGNMLYILISRTQYVLSIVYTITSKCYL